VRGIGAGVESCDAAEGPCGGGRAQGARDRVAECVHIGCLLLVMFTLTYGSMIRRSQSTRSMGRTDALCTGQLRGLAVSCDAVMKPSFIWIMVALDLRPSTSLHVSQARDGGNCCVRS
jgi:hypothetical protein